MDKMKELYEKVAKNSELQAKFYAIMSEAEKAGEAATGEKLRAFAKEVGYEVTVAEMADFFSKLETKEGALSEEELDAVAGGKTNPNLRPHTIMIGTEGCGFRFSGINGFEPECLKIDL